MKASTEHPVYSARIVKSNGTTYRLKDITTDLIVSHPKGELAEKAVATLVDVKVGNDLLRNLIALQDKVYINADTGSGESEVFRGLVWERDFSYDADTDEINIVCYNRLIYMQKSKDNFFAKSGKTTKSLVETLANKWGFKISFKYKSITHGKLTFHNESVADILISILDEVKKKKGVGYVIRMSGDTIVIETEGSNKTVYKLVEKKNAISTSFKETMDGMVTKVLIVKAETTDETDNSEQSIVELAKSYMESDPSLSYADAIAKAKEKVNGSSGSGETGNYLTVTSVSKNTSKYGTLQQIITISKDENLSEAKEEANQTLEDNATPQKEYDIKSVDVPWVKKGDQIYITAGSLNGYYIVDSVEHDTLNYIMYLEVSKYE